MDLECPLYDIMVNHTKGVGFVKNKSNNEQYGREIGYGIKESLKGINTMASPKKKKTCLILFLMPLAAAVLGIIGGVTKK